MASVGRIIRLRGGVVVDGTHKVKVEDESLGHTQRKLPTRKRCQLLLDLIKTFYNFRVTYRSAGKGKKVRHLTWGEGDVEYSLNVEDEAGVVEPQGIQRTVAAVEDAARENLGQDYTLESIWDALDDDDTAASMHEEFRHVLLRCAQQQPLKAEGTNASHRTPLKDLANTSFTGDWGDSTVLFDKVAPRNARLSGATDTFKSRANSDAFEAELSECALGIDRGVEPWESEEEELVSTDAANAMGKPWPGLGDETETEADEQPAPSSPGCLNSDPPLHVRDGESGAEENESLATQPPPEQTASDEEEATSPPLSPMYMCGVGESPHWSFILSSGGTHRRTRPRTRFSGNTEQPWWEGESVPPQTPRFAEEKEECDAMEREGPGDGDMRRGMWMVVLVVLVLSILLVTVDPEAPLGQPQLSGVIDEGFCHGRLPFGPLCV